VDRDRGASVAAGVVNDVYLRASYAGNSYCFGGVYLSVCLSVRTQSHNYWSEVDVTWQEYVPC